MKRCSIMICFLALVLACAPQASAALYTLTDQNSSVTVDTASQAGAYNWAVDGQDILYQRYEYGSYPGTSALATSGTGSFGGAPNYTAANSDNDTRLQVTNLPGGMNVTLGGMMYVTEIFSRHTLITPLNRFGITVPQSLYSIAYF